MFHQDEKKPFNFEACPGLFSQGVIMVKIRNIKVAVIYEWALAEVEL